MATNEQIVNNFIDAWGRLNAEELAGFFTEDAVYHNIPMRPAIGIASVRKVLGAMMRDMTGVKFEVRYQAAAGNIVMNERIDHITNKDGKKISLPVAGVFELENGKIKAWRDYFDMAMFNSAAAA